ncbi:segment polarity protein dishevelled homolog DVL-3-like isoform X2 [Sycon ciliatum]|uniref:segment polarity protein dishevelled homolog DVL-3-like isoform X2 n=1 Tax=Sycon ciliatum TaxID=27933 RepID=UPI0031F66538
MAEETKADGEQQAAASPPSTPREDGTASPAPTVSETKIVYHIGTQDMPYLVKVAKTVDKVTLLDFKNSLSRPLANTKFFFKTIDEDIGVVKEEIESDDSVLPSEKGRIVAWLVRNDPAPSEGSDKSSNGGSAPDLVKQVTSRQVKHYPSSASNRKRSSTSDLSSSGRKSDGDCLSLGSALSDDDARSRRSGRHRQSSRSGYRKCSSGTASDSGSSVDRRRRRQVRTSGHESEPGLSGTESMAETMSVMSSELDASSYFESDCSSRVSCSDVQSVRSARFRSRRKRKHLPRYESYSSVTESTVESLNILTVTLDMENVNFLGISIVGQSNDDGDGGIFVGSVMKGGAVDLDGRIGPGDMILQVNDVNFEELNNDSAVKVMRDIVKTPGPITITVAKCFDPTPVETLETINPRTDPVHPIDPSAWVKHTQAIQALYGSYTDGTMSSITSTSSGTSFTGSELPEADRPILPRNNKMLSADTPVDQVARIMAASNSGLEVRDRMWLKIVIPRSFIGSDVVEWLFTNIEGLKERRQARKYASSMLRAGHIRHTVNKITFSEQCYYIFSAEIIKDFPHLQVQSSKNGKNGNIKVAGSDRPVGPWTPLSYTIAGPRAMGMMTDSSSGGGANSERMHQYLRPYDSMSMSTLASLHRNAAAETSSLDSHVMAGHGHAHSPGGGHGTLEQHSPNGSVTSVDSSASTITSASRVAANQYRKIRRHFDAMSVSSSNNLSDKEKERLSRIASKLRRGSMSSLNTLSSAVPLSPASGMTAQQNGKQMVDTDMTSMSHSADVQSPHSKSPHSKSPHSKSPHPKSPSPLLTNRRNGKNVDNVSLAASDISPHQQQHQQQAGLQIQLPAHLAVSQQSFRQAMKQPHNQFYMDVMYI